MRSGVAFIFGALLAGHAVAAPKEPAEVLRFDPPGYREYDLAEPEAAADILDDAPEGLTPIVPAAEEGVSKRFFMPKKRIADGIVQMVVESRPDDGRTTATGMLAKRGAALAAVCPGAMSAPVPESEDGGFRVALVVSQCPRDPAIGLGRVMVTKLILGGDRVHVIEAEFRFAPFPPDAAPMSDAQADAVVGLLAPVKVCYGRKEEDCRIRPRHLAEATPREIPEEQVEAIARVEQLGELLFRHDQIAWHGTDALTDRAFDLQGLTAAGWLTRITAGAPDELVYVARRAGAPVGVVLVKYDGTPPSVTDLKSEPLAGDWQRWFKALDTTREEQKLACGQSFNTVVFPDPQSGDLLVYWMSATNAKNTMVNGGHTRFRVSADGATIIKRQPMSKGCLTMPFGDPKPMNVVLQHVVTDMPTELHAFNSRLFKVPVVVIAESGTWRITEGRIERIY